LCSHKFVKIKIKGKYNAATIYLETEVGDKKNTERKKTLTITSGEILVLGLIFMSFDFRNK